MCIRVFSRTPLLIAIVSLVSSLFVGQARCTADEILVVDRLANAVDRYSDAGTFLGTLISNDPQNLLPTDLNQPDGIAISPDHTKLFVASSQNNQVTEYDYNYAAGTVSNPSVFATAADGLSFPNSMVFSPDGSKLYVANLGGTGITQLNASGGMAGAPLSGGSSYAFSGLALNANGQVVAGGFDGSTVAESDLSVSSLTDLVPSNALLTGAAGVLVNGNDLYVTGLFAHTLVKFNATTGAIDPTFNVVSGLGYPQGLMLAPDGQGLLVGILGFSTGTGNISEYDFNGNFLSTFASAGTGGFTEATAMLSVPEPTSLALAGMAAALIVFAAPRRTAR